VFGLEFGIEGLAVCLMFLFGSTVFLGTICLGVSSFKFVEFVLYSLVN
jgi:cell shape-determining protein MreD